VIPLANHSDDAGAQSDVSPGLSEAVSTFAHETKRPLFPGAGRIRPARSFTAWEGGGESNTTELEILPRVGAATASPADCNSGFSNSMIRENREYDAAHGALASTTPGDTSMATR
jgi:hypothetical protein